MRQTVYDPFPEDNESGFETCPECNGSGSVRGSFYVNKYTEKASWLEWNEDLYDDEINTYSKYKNDLVKCEFCKGSGKVWWEDVQGYNYNPSWNNPNTSCLSITVLFFTLILGSIIIF